MMLLFGVMSAAPLAADLSRYRNYQFGTNLPAVAKQVGTSSADARVIHMRPALIQELTWRPQLPGTSLSTEPVQEVVFGFYNGKLYRIAVIYDRYETEGLTVDDIVQTISATYGVAAKPSVMGNSAQGYSEDQGEVVAQWKNPQYSFDLTRSSYGPSYRLIGTSLQIEAQARLAILEALRLDDKEAPQRDAARTASEEDTARVRLERARTANKAKFRP
ncbi:MAG TPA: hypothetical protein PLZ95_11850 [Bryobacteraceae bacterium]|nr:hypothetical protein [Bryobacteraceae bacterium]